ncbi:hypothetical protein AGMMS49531_10480 [Endomicrobiia bacterium]|nr:hypothetical protein AGMMS49531_10480 [Endomicrobiia bacterium]
MTPVTVTSPENATSERTDTETIINTSFFICNLPFALIKAQ